MKKGTSLLIAIGSKKPQLGSMSSSDRGSNSMKEYAAENLMKAIKSGDAMKLSDAFEEMMQCCSMESEEDFEEEEYN